MAINIVRSHASLSAIKIFSKYNTFGGKSETVQLIVVPDDRTNDLDDYVRLEDESKEPLSLRDGDVYLSKSSQLVLGIQPGDTAYVQDSSLNVAKVKVSDISLNYLGNTLYMTIRKQREQFLRAKSEARS